MAQVQVNSELTYDVQQTTVLLLKIAAASTNHQQVIEDDLQFNPMLDVERCEVGPDANRLQRVIVEPCQLNIRYQGTVQLTPDIDRPQDVGRTPPNQIPLEVLTYLNPSRYCESDLLGRFAFEEFGQLSGGHGCVQAICDWVYGHLDYTPGSTDATTTAADVVLRRTGVCRDFAHLAIALCRGVGIPARYVSGYAVDLQPPDYHGFMEAFLDGQWYLFDPTRLASTQSLVRIGVGRDAADVAFASLTGSANLTDKIVSARFIDSPNDPNRSTAVSTA